MAVVPARPSRLLPLRHRQRHLEQPHHLLHVKRLRKARRSLIAARKANECDMEDHAAKARDLLEQASAEIKRAAQEANENKK